MTTQSSEHTLELRFTDIFKRHEYKLYTLALALTKSDQYAKDIVQDVFMKLWEHRNHIHTIANMDAWLYRLTENKVIDFLRKTAADKRLRDALWMNMQHMMNETEETISSREYKQVIEKAINHLPPQRKRIYRLSKEQGLNYCQIAHELDISRHTVKNQLSSALRAVRNFLSRTMKLFF
ncbi:RNA polymerase sigma-70 factor [Agriterribacter sp.]|uniref:RNA polymerase sigma factor n=1 Tax=Agriterribacter sp. TaxID=2821509 RepID=UPI002B87405B|nr:RNA polymerase sigma-70 factor [Agriterribacter sp.]HRO47998.1 RNA polymerase sigma-70 factor [Agriterribacter sp.]HRQ16231.1 RNA polymerase sigma-70 factor [Agriterribacter sp.]